MEREWGEKKGNVWWPTEIKDAVKRKKRAYKKMLQRNLPKEVKVRRKSEYKEWKKRVRKMIKMSKRRVDEEFGRKLSQNFSENKKHFWKEVTKVRGGERSGDVWMRGENGELGRGESELKGIWKGYL